MKNNKTSVKKNNITPLINLNTEDAQYLKDLKLQLNVSLSENELLNLIFNYYNKLNDMIVKEYNENNNVNPKVLLINLMEDIKLFLKQLEVEDEKLDNSINNFKDNIVNCYDNNCELKELENKLFVRSQVLLEKQNYLNVLQENINEISCYVSKYGNNSKTIKKNLSYKTCDIYNNEELIIYDFDNLDNENLICKLYESKLKVKRDDFAKYSRHTNYLLKEIERINIDMKRIESTTNNKTSSVSSTTEKTRERDLQEKEINKYSNDNNNSYYDINKNSQYDKYSIKEEQLNEIIIQQENQIKELDIKLDCMENEYNECQKDINVYNRILSEKYTAILVLEKKSLSFKKINS